MQSPEPPLQSTRDIIGNIPPLDRAEGATNFSNLSNQGLCLLAFLEQYVKEHGRPPTQTEMATSMGFSRYRVQATLGELEGLGLIKRDRGFSRAVQIINNQNTKLEDAAREFRMPLDRLLRVPLRDFTGQPPAIFDPTVDEERSDFIELSRSMFSVKPIDLVAFKVSGDEFLDALIIDGDIFIFQPWQEVRNGDFVVISTNSQIIIRYIFNEGSQVRLQSANPILDPIYVLPEQIEILGKVRLIIRSYEATEVSRQWWIKAIAPFFVNIQSPFVLSIEIRPGPLSLDQSSQIENAILEELNLVRTFDEVPVQVSVKATKCRIEPSKEQKLRLRPNSEPLMNFLLIPESSGVTKIHVDVNLEPYGAQDSKTHVLGTSIGKVHLDIHVQARINKKKLRAWLERYFSRDELIDLCWSLGIPFEHFDGSTFPKLARELLDYIERRDLIDEFLDACREARPEAYNVLGV